MLKSIAIIFGVLILLDIIFFGLMILFSMTDEAAGPMAKISSNVLKYVLGFPAVLFNRNWPFFLDHSKINAILAITIIFLNNAILAGLIHYVKRLFG